MRPRFLLIVSATLILGAGVTLAAAPSALGRPVPARPGHVRPAGTPQDAQGINLIQHVIVIMQENRSFDSYFGVYPGADGIPMSGGVPTVCVPDPTSRRCIRPYVDHADINIGGPHPASSFRIDLNGGKMNGFVDALRQVPRCGAADDPE